MKNGEDDYDLFSWGNEFTRGGDPGESHDAVGKIDIGNDRQLVFDLFSQLLAKDPDHATRKVLEFQYLIAKGYRANRADSLTRRLSDLVERKQGQRPNPFPRELWLFIHSGKRYDGSAILTYTERGLLVLENQKIMAGLWGLKREKKRADPGTDPPDES